MDSHYLNSALLHLWKILWFFKTVQVQGTSLLKSVPHCLREQYIVCKFRGNPQEYWNKSGGTDSSGIAATILPFQGHFQSAACQVPHSCAAFCIATGKFAGNEAVGKARQGSSARAFISCTFRNQRCISLVQRMRTGIISKRTGYLF